jgi:putative ABC transport system permease protein
MANPGREYWGLLFEIDTTWADIRHGLRRIAKRPFFSLAVIGTLALASGMNVTVFSAVYGVLLRPLPFRSPEQLVSVGELHPSVPESRVASYRSFAEWRDRSSAFQGITATRPTEFTMAGDGDPQRINGTRVTANFFDVMGIEPLYGRGFTAEDDKPKGATATVINERLWHSRFHGDPNIIGRSIRVDGQRRTIIGVMPAREDLPTIGWSDLWIPMAVDDTSARIDGSRWLLVTGRLKPGVTAAAAETQVRSIQHRLAGEFSSTHQGWDARVKSLDEIVTGKIRASLFVLFGAALSILIIACVNLASLLVTHARDQSSELAIRVALGASRARLVRQLGLQFMMLVVLGTMAGLTTASKLVPFFVGVVASDVPRLEAIQVDQHALFFALGLMILIGVVFLLGPALWGTNAGFQQTLRSGSRGIVGASGSTVSIKRVLAVGQLAVTTVLLVASALFIRSFTRLEKVNPGFNTDHLVFVDMALPPDEYRDPARQTAFFHELTRRIAEIRGIDSAAVVRFAPLANGKGRTSFQVAGHTYIQGSEPLVNYNIASGDYFRTLGIPVKSGRTFTETEVWNGAPVAILSESAARRFWPSSNALGEHVRIGATGDLCEVIGIVGDVSRDRLDVPADPEVYLPIAKLPGTVLQLVARTNGNPALKLADVRQTIRNLDSSLPTDKATTAGQAVSQSLAGHRFRTSAMSGFGSVAFALAVVGIYGVTAYSVSLRLREFGVRMALGASRRRVVGSVLVESLAIGSAGVILGLIGGVFVCWLLRSILFESPTVDPVVLAGVGLVLLIVTTVACISPAWRAARADIRSVLQPT